MLTRNPTHQATRFAGFDKKNIVKYWQSGLVLTKSLLVGNAEHISSILDNEWDADVNIQSMPGKVMAEISS